MVAIVEATLAVEALALSNGIAVCILWRPGWARTAANWKALLRLTKRAIFRALNLELLWAGRHLIQ